MVQVLLMPSPLFIESLGSYSRCRVSNGVMPCVLGPTSFNLKFWANILISDEHQNVVVFMMIFIWVHHVWMNTWSSGLCICFSYEFLDNNQCMDFSSYIRMFLSHILSWNRCRRILWDSASSCPCFERLCCPCSVPTLRRVYLLLKMTDLLCFCFLLFTYCTVHKVSMSWAWTFWSSECLIFMMFFIWVHQGWMSDEFLDPFHTWHEICSSVILQKLLLHMHQKLLEKVG